MRAIDIITQAVVKARIARKGKIAPELKESALDALNRVYERAFNLFPWDNIKIFSIDATTTDGIITLPQTVDIIRAARIDNRPLDPVNEIRVANWIPSRITEVGTPRAYMYLPDSPVQDQPAAATTVRLVSSNAADTSIVHIEGLVGGLEDEEEITLDGTTPVNGIKSFTELRKITKDKTIGRITVKDSGDVELGTVPPWEHNSRYKRVQLVPIVDSSTTATFECLRRFEALVSDNDSTLIPKGDPALVNLLVSELLEDEEEEDRAAVYRQKGDADLQILSRQETEIQDKDFDVAPEMGLFGDLGDEFGDERFVRDISETGIG